MDLRIRRWDDNELVSAIEKIAADLNAQGKAVSGGAVLTSLGVSRQALKAYPRAKNLIKKIKSNHRQQRLAEYIERLKLVIMQLKNSDIRISEFRIIKVSGISRDTIRRWPELRELVSVATGQPVILAANWPRKKTGDTRVSARGTKLEDELLSQVEEAIHHLKSQGEDITQVAICRLTGRVDRD